MENEEIQLRELKKELLKKVTYLRDKLKDQEENRHQKLINFNTTLSSDDEDYELSEFPSIKYKAKLCEITGQVTGITFKNVDKKWLRDDVYMYFAKVVTKTISFDVRLTVTFKNLNDFKIKDIMCYFIDVQDCYMLEITSWFQKITKMKNFSLLMSALSDYNENNILRSKILHSLELKKYASTELCTQENGGILVYIHSPIDTEKSYVIFQWTMTFLDLTWQIEHFFTVKSTNTGMEFSEENRSLLKEFCKIGLTKNDLMELWEKLCIAVDEYMRKNT
ncbi:PREDICTED: uncharacterized protein LOC105459079 [Wasmannia auropunctata]|uniref:uncharacterized protein LOC105459079 n=1 Tax=Wasmannia auropunctata TaxID=64793 RepID=UPI0005ED8E42|nr:PREDICTED: uncharacterized protein LOC105459079 [Wasmannia auropunctata]XP_011703073.1 PREDICTED: uncharacterized protein LOC105459079 [Wasmannia auropunctata]